MKKIFAVLLALIMVFAFVGCGKDKTEKDNSQTAKVEFEKPEGYVSVITVTINPKFNLYLDENSNVLAVEPVNKDAEKVIENVDFKGKDVKEAVESIITVANENGFIKEDATIDIQIIEKKNENVNTTELLNTTKTAVDNKIAALEIKVKVEVEDKTIETSSESQPADSSVPENTTSSSTQSKPSSTSNKPSNTSSKPVHTHSYSAATCTQAAKCSCGAVKGNALGHDYFEGVCRRCGVNDPNYALTSVKIMDGYWSLMYLGGNTLNDVSLTLFGNEIGLGVGYGDDISDWPPEQFEEMKKESILYGGKYYYFGRGDGDSLQSVTENGKTITVKDSSGAVLTLERTGETTMKVTNSPAAFGVLEGKIPVGTVLTFKTE